MLQEKFKFLYLPMLHRVFLNPTWCCWILWNFS